MTPTVTPTPPGAITASAVWVRFAPYLDAPRLTAIPKGTPLIIYAVYGPWVEVTWQEENVVWRGWIPLRWVTLNEPIPDGRITPTLAWAGS